MFRPTENEAPAGTGGGQPPGHSNLPDAPDFDAVRAAAQATAGRRAEIFALIGQLTFAWSNNESMFIYVLMLLLHTDQPGAAIVFGTLNTTRARLDLVQRLAKVRVGDPAIAARLAKLLKTFDEGTRLRNEFNHAMYSVDENGAITHTHAMRIEERRGRLEFGRERAMDEARLAEMGETIRRMNALNRDLWAFLPALEAHMREAAPSPAT
ncbi:MULTISPECIES: hypothetical protein [unclassified Aureimonas]|uniref:hypothetical protein n=1 Tax=unclassified Aureimonas TaxID=2615206 RepID=UPI001FCD29D5|nr:MULTISPECIES: hypothetical protein [unclassified Aureimonas]